MRAGRTKKIEGVKKKRGDSFQKGEEEEKKKEENNSHLVLCFWLNRRLRRFLAQKGSRKQVRAVREKRKKK